MNARIAPLSPPYAADVKASLDKWMPPGSGLEPLKLFRTVARHPLLSERMRALGSALLGRSTLPLRTRELLVLRTCARCHAEYEWGVHVTAFAAAAGLDDDAVRATTRPGEPGDGPPGDALVLRFVDELHDTGSVTNATWTGLAGRYEANQLLEMLAVAGFYHLISFVVNGARVEAEPWAATFPGSTLAIVP
jgi:4-carboxymuconolactone decarboxylase